MRRRPSSGTATPRKTRIAAKSQYMEKRSEPFWRERARATGTSRVDSAGQAAVWFLRIKISDENFDSRKRRTGTRDCVEMPAERGRRKNLVRAGKWRHRVGCGMCAGKSERCSRDGRPGRKDWSRPDNCGARAATGERRRG